jgi:hypothetical protein
MSKKKDQVKYLKKNFNSVLKAFEKEKSKVKRKDFFDFLSGQISEIKLYTIKGGEVPVPLDTAMPKPENTHTGRVEPSQGLVEEIIATHQAMQN